MLNTDCEEILMMIYSLPTIQYFACTHCACHNLGHFYNSFVCLPLLIKRAKTVNFAVRKGKCIDDPGPNEYIPH